MGKVTKLDTKFIYIIPIAFALFSSEMLFSVIRVNGNTTSKIISLGCTIASFLVWKNMQLYMRVWYALSIMYLSFLVLESMHNYNNNPMIYPHVLAKIFDLFIMFFIYGFYSRYPDKISFGQVAWFIFIFFILYSTTTEARNTFTISAFVGNHRGFSSESTYLVAVPFIYFFNYYFSSKKFYSSLLFLGLIGFLFFSQQRTVWVVTGLALVVNIILMKRSNFKIDMGALTPIFILISIVAMFVSSFVLTNEEVMERLSQSAKNFSSVDNDKDGGTAAWRRRQAESYAPYVNQYVIGGMRFEGFELPIQFKEGVALWGGAAGGGHHFHSFYLDKLFYFGYIGLLLFVIPYLIRIIALIFFIRKFIDLEQITTACYCLTMLVYGISYDVPSYFYSILGYMFFLLERDNTNKYKKVEPAPQTETAPKLEVQLS